jgi:hypothetical protein
MKLDECTYINVNVFPILRRISSIRCVFVTDDGFRNTICGSCFYHQLDLASAVETSEKECCLINGLSDYKACINILKK